MNAKDLEQVCGVKIEKRVIEGKDKITRTFYEEIMMTDEIKLDDSEGAKQSWVPRRWNNFQLAFLTVLQRTNMLDLAKGELDCVGNVKKAIEFARTNYFINGRPKNLASSKGFKSYNGLLKAITEDFNDLCEKVDVYRKSNLKTPINESN